MELFRGRGPCRRAVVALAATAAVVGSGGTPAFASDDSEATSAAVARAVAAQIPGATIRSAEPGRIDPLFNVPGLDDLVAGRADVMLDPNFWVATVGNLLQSGSIVLPTPIDVVKPEAFLPTAPVSRGSGAVSVLPRRDRDLSGITYTWQGRPKTIREFMRTTETDVVAFVHRGNVIADAYENGWSSTVLHQPWSVTKSFVSSLVGIAIGERRVRSVRDTIDTYLPEVRGTAWEGVTIQNLLEMESGVHWDEDTPVLAVNTQVQQWIQAALDLVTDGQLGQSRDEFLDALPRVAEQGTRFSYNSGNTQMLGRLLEAVYEAPFNEVVSTKLWAPAGMEADARVLTDRVGDAIASQGLYSRVFDLARFGEIFRLGGRTPEGARIVPEAWVRESTRHTEISKGRYAYQWWSGPTPGSYEASGFQGQKISVSPDHCLVGVRLSHAFGLDSRPDDGSIVDPAAYGFGTEFGSGEWAAAFRAVAAEVGECPRPTPAVAPTLRLGTTTVFSRRAALRRGALRVRIAGQGRRMIVRLRATRRVRRADGRGTRSLRVATRRLTVRPGPARTVSVPLTREGRRWLRSRRRATVTLTAVGGGAPTGRPTARRAVRLR